MQGRFTTALLLFCGMQAPWFYEPQAHPGVFELGDESFKHAVQVLRMRPGSALKVTNGTGLVFTGTLLNAGKKTASVKLESYSTITRPLPAITLAVSPLKNVARFEWLLEKAGELGVEQIVPLHCEHTVKANFRQDRMQNILVSAMLQSQQAWLPKLEPIQSCAAFLETNPSQMLIAHCAAGEKSDLLTVGKGLTAMTLLIGPEGDFSTLEIEQALEAGAKAITLGNIRLRSETAAVSALAAIRLGLP